MTFLTVNSRPPSEGRKVLDEKKRAAAEKEETAACLAS
jgi:hypothetical protein